MDNGLLPNSSELRKTCHTSSLQLRDSRVHVGIQIASEGQIMAHETVHSVNECEFTLHGLDDGLTLSWVA
jgi:hypothetical protein